MSVAINGAYNGNVNSSHSVESRAQILARVSDDSSESKKSALNSISPAVWGGVLTSINIEGLSPGAALNQIVTALNKAGVDVSPTMESELSKDIPEMQNGVLPKSMASQLPSPLDDQVAESLKLAAVPNPSQQQKQEMSSLGGSLFSQLGNDGLSNSQNVFLLVALAMLEAGHDVKVDSLDPLASAINTQNSYINETSNAGNGSLASLSTAFAQYNTEVGPTATDQLSNLMQWAYGITPPVAKASWTPAMTAAQQGIQGYLNQIGASIPAGANNTINTYTSGVPGTNTLSSALTAMQANFTAFGTTVPTLQQCNDMASDITNLTYGITSAIDGDASSEILPTSSKTVTNSGFSGNPDLSQTDMSTLTAAIKNFGSTESEQSPMEQIQLQAYTTTYQQDDSLPAKLIADMAALYQAIDQA